MQGEDIHNRRWDYLQLLLLFIAFVSALFFNGNHIPWFSLSLSALLLALLNVLLVSYRQTIRIPLSAVTVSISLFYIWLAVSVSWSTVAYVSKVNLLWQSALLFTCMLLLIRRPDAWFMQRLYTLLFTAAAVLAIVVAVQALLLHQQPTGPFLNKNSLAALLNGLLLPMLTFQLFNKANLGKTKTILYELAIFLCFLAIVIIQSRGALLSLLLCALMAGLMLRRQLSLRFLLRTGMSLLLAIVLANSIDWQAGVLERFETLADPASAGSHRFLIWQSSWELLQQQPWRGIGLGVFWLVYPQYRQAADNSGGFYVHNDYLQIWIEAGLPALLIMLAVFISLTLAVWRARQRLDERQLAEMMGLYAGFLVIAAHSFFTFNFYTLPILIMLGIYLARLCLITTDHSIRQIQFSPANHVTVVAWRSILALLCLFPVSYLCFFAASDIFYNRAKTEASNGHIEQAFEHLDTANALFPNSDNFYFLRAELMNEVLATLPADMRADKDRLFTDGNQLLAQAIRLNPLRPHSYYLRGRLCENNPIACGENYREQALADYGRAQKLDPRHYPSRLAMARLLQKSGQPDQASQVLEAGMALRYPRDPNLIPYYLAVIASRQQRDPDSDMTDAIAAIDTLLTVYRLPYRYADIQAGKIPDNSLPLD
jgi:O-antigen ligase